jgi:hypothetical protein
MCRLVTDRRHYETEVTITVVVTSQYPDSGEDIVKVNLSNIPAIKNVITVNQVVYEVDPIKGTKELYLK